jgi:hypothetical protein
MNVWDYLNDEEKEMVFSEKADEADVNENVHDTISFLKMRYAEAGKSLYEVEEMEKRILKYLEEV